MKLGRLDLRLWLAALAALVALAIAPGCNAGPQPEPPERPEDRNVMGRGANGQWLWPSGPDRGDDEPAPPPPAGYADAGARAPDAGAGPADPSVPWLDSDGEAGLSGAVSPFPFEPCCGWFLLPDADAGPDAGD